MARSSDITSITRDTIRFEDERVHFTYYATKESKSFQEVPMFINSYKEERLICTVSVLQAYLTRTRDYSLHNEIEFVLHIVDGKEIRRSPLLVSDYRNRDDKFFELSTQRIAKINTDVLKKLNITVFKAHSYRGASSSKVYNLGGDIQRVLERARWASDATFRKYYLRKKAYQQHSRSNQYLTIEFLLRMRTDPAGSVKRKESTLVDRDEEKEVIVVDDEVES
jgi:integrase